MSTPLRVCACGKVALTEQDLELFKKNHTCRHGRENICITCHNLKINKLYNPKNNTKRKVLNTPIVISGVAGICRLCHKSTEVFNFHSDDSSSTLTFCKVCLSDAEIRKNRMNETILTYKNKIAESDGADKVALENTLAGRKQAYKFYFDSLK